MKEFACFTITGKALTRIARDLMLSDDPGAAYRLLADGLIGENSLEVAFGVLTGKTNLIGDSNIGITTEPAEDTQKYIEDLNYIYACRVRLKGRWYRPRGMITSFGRQDANSALKEGITPRSAAWGRKRAEFYANENEIVELVSINHTNIFVTFSPCGDPPQWMMPCLNPQEAVNRFLSAGRILDELGYHPQDPVVEAKQMIRDLNLKSKEADDLIDLAYEAETEQFNIQIQNLTDQIREQAGNDTFPLTLLDGRVVQVPTAPFTHWALSRLPGPKNLPEWKVVSPSGLKMQNDDPYHTDWVLGAGLTLDEIYSSNVNHPAWEKVTELQIEEVDKHE